MGIWGYICNYDGYMVYMWMLEWYLWVYVNVWWIYLDNGKIRRYDGYMGVCVDV